MRFPSKKAIGAALALGVVAALVTALPAYAVAAAITSFTPPCGIISSTSVQVSGSNFTGSTGLQFAGPATAPVVVNSDFLITATVPVGAITGTLKVINPVNGDSAASASTFTVVAAALPTISNFAPTSGPVGTFVIITGTNFCGTQQVRFGATPATSFTVNSATQITAAVPVGATTGVVSVTQPGGTATTVTNFTVTGTLPTITSFAPTSGPVGTSVVITGTNFTGATSVKFNLTAATVFVVNSATQITATVPSGATTGTISVTNPSGTGTSVTAFTVTTPNHSRSVSFSFSGNRASGNVSVGDGYNACHAFVPVYVQQLKNGNWTLLDTTATNASGAFSTWVPDRVGTFRAFVRKLTLVNGAVCKSDASPNKHHS